MITDGLFLRRLQADPSREGVRCLLFDEFQNAGQMPILAFALLESATLRPDLAVVVMSATLDLSDLRSAFPRPPCWRATARLRWTRSISRRDRMNRCPSRCCRPSRPRPQPAQPSGSPGVPAWTPGDSALPCPSAPVRHCRTGRSRCSMARCPSATSQGPCSMRPRPAGGVILSSAIAESSVTVEGVGLVIDSGLSRQLRYDPNTGMEGLETGPSSVASADQRRGRAGRQGPGTCVRLWSPAEQQRRPAFSPPELQLADPMPLVMELAQWGAGLGDALPWLDPPSPAALREGQRTLQAMDVVTAEGGLSTTGRRLSRLSVHPRLGLLMLEAQRRGCPGLGCDLAALLSDRDPLAGRNAGADLGRRLEALDRRRECRQQQQLSRQLRQQLTALNNGDNAGSNSLDARWHRRRPAALRIPGMAGGATGGATRALSVAAGARGDSETRGSAVGQTALAVARLDLGGRDCRIQLALPCPAPASKR